MELGKEITEALSIHEFNIPLFGYNIPVSDTVIISWIIMIFIIGFAYFFTRKMVRIPSKKQNFIEILVELVNNITEQSVGHHWKHFAPYLGTILLFLIVSNTISLFNIIPNWHQIYLFTGVEFFKELPSFGLRPPTKDINVTVSMAVMTIIIVIGSGIRFKKVSGWLKSFFEHGIIMAPMKTMEYFTRILSLSLRLFGNIIAAFIIMELLYAALPAFVPGIASIYFDIFDGILQAYIFVFLTSLYIAEAIE